MNRVEQIRAALQAALAPTELDVVDDSARHAGHAGARDRRGHFNVRVVSAAFVGKPLLARHRAVYAAVGEMMQTDIHALSIKAFAPGEAGAPGSEQVVPRSIACRCHSALGRGGMSRLVL